MKQILSLKDTSLIDDIKLKLIGVEKMGDIKKLIIPLLDEKEKIEEVKIILNDYTKTFREIKKEFENVELDIKEQVEKFFQKRDWISQKVNEKTGEVSHIKKEAKNTKGFFSYSEPKTKTIIDMEQITKDKFPNLFKQIWVLDKDKLNKEDITKLPTKEIVEKARVGIMYANVRSQLIKKGLK